MHIRQTLKNTWTGLLDFCSRLEEVHRQRMETPTPCCNCQKVYFYKDLRPTLATLLTELRDSPSFREFGLAEERLCSHSYCPSCWKPLQEERARVRKIINEEHARQQRLAECFPKESRLVSNHNTRALLAGGKATLTIGQWINTLEYYNWLCAYCSGPYEELEHRIPIDRGGGTTAKNCVPSCQSCNRRKGALHPDEIIARESSLSPEAHRRIEAEMQKLHTLNYVYGTN